LLSALLFFFSLQVPWIDIPTYLRASNNGAMAAWSAVEQAAELKSVEIDRTDSRPTQANTSRLSAQFDIMPSRPKPRPA
jgi:hypothetical protein